MVSASVNRSQDPRAAQAPAVTAWFLPVHPGGSGPAGITRTLGNEAAISAVRSVEWSSTTMSSNGTPVCETRDWRQTPRLASSLRAGMITEICGVGDDSVAGIIWFTVRGRDCGGGGQACIRTHDAATAPAVANPLL